MTRERVLMALAYAAFAGMVLASNVRGFLLIAWLAYVPVAVELARIDFRERRLPDRLTLPAAGGALVLLALDGFSIGFFPLYRAFLGAIVLFLAYFAMNLLTRGGMGMGDVKLALSIGALTGYLSWESVVVATMVAFLIGGGVSAYLLATGRSGRKDAIPFGPFMIIGAFAAVWLRSLELACLLGYVTCV